MAVLLRHAAAVGVPLLSAGRDLFVTVEHRDLDGQRIGCAGPGWSLSPLTLGMLGSFQPENALLAVAAARALGVGAAAIGQGLARARWPGRFQVLARDGGWLVLDGAHNPGGARALVSSLRDYFGSTAVTFVVGILRDKDAPAILAELAPLARRLILTGSFQIPMRGLSAATLLLAGALLAGPLPSAALAPGPVTVRTNGDVTILADRIEEVASDNLLVATGNVEVSRGTARLLADRVELNRDTGDGVALGRVIFYDGDDQLTGERIEYNVRTGTGVIYRGRILVAPAYWIAGERL